MQYWILEYLRRRAPGKGIPNCGIRPGGAPAPAAREARLGIGNGKPGWRPPWKRGEDIFFYICDHCKPYLIPWNCSAYKLRQFQTEQFQQVQKKKDFYLRCRNLTIFWDLPTTLSQSGDFRPVCLKIVAGH